MNRRRFLLGIGGLITGFACAPSYQLPRPADPPRPLTRKESIEAWQHRIRSILGRGKLPIIHTESTYWQTMDIDYIISEMDRHDIAQICFAPGFHLGSETSLRLHEAYPEYFVPTTADASSWHWYRQPKEFNKKVFADFRTGKYFLLGEYELRHYPSHQQWLASRRWGRPCFYALRLKRENDIDQLCLVKRASMPRGHCTMSFAVVSNAAVRE